MAEVEVSFRGDKAKIGSLLTYIEGTASLYGLYDVQVQPIAEVESPYVPRAELISFIDEVRDDEVTGMGLRVVSAISNNHRYTHASMQSRHGRYSLACVPEMPDGLDAVTGIDKRDERLWYYDYAEYHEDYVRFAAEHHRNIVGLGAKGAGFLALFLETRARTSPQA